MNWIKENKLIAGVGAIVIALGILFALGVGSKARAADKGGVADEYAPVKSALAGIYVGVAGGYSIASTEISVGGGSLDGVGMSGMTGELVIGTDIKLANSPIVLGLYGKYGLADTEFSINPGLFSAKLTSQYAFGGRIGYATASFMPYVFAGYRHTEVDWSVASPALPTSFNGLEAGGGIEGAWSKNVSLYVEGRYTKYNAEKIGPFSLEPADLAVLGGLKLRF